MVVRPSQYLKLSILIHNEKGLIKAIPLKPRAGSNTMHDEEF